MSIHPVIVPRADWRYYGLEAPSASRSRRFLAPTTLLSPAMGSSGSKKTRKGKSRQHLAKVGTPANQAYESEVRRSYFGPLWIGGLLLFIGVVALLIVLVAI